MISTPKTSKSGFCQVGVFVEISRRVVKGVPLMWWWWLCVRLAVQASGMQGIYLTLEKLQYISHASTPSLVFTGVWDPFRGLWTHEHAPMHMVGAQVPGLELNLGP